MAYYKRAPIEWSMPSYNVSGWGLTVSIQGERYRINRFYLAFYLRCHGNMCPAMMVSYIKDNLRKKRSPPWFPTEYGSCVKNRRIRSRYERIADHLVKDGLLVRVETG